jgi:hypothetical protein
MMDLAGVGATRDGRAGATRPADDAMHRGNGMRRGNHDKCRHCRRQISAEAARIGNAVLN